MLTQIPALAGLRCKSKSAVKTALSLYNEKNIHWTDAFVPARMLAASQPVIYSYDRDFDRITGIKRLVPGWKQSPACLPV